jgi:predicted permease
MVTSGTTGPGKETRMALLARIGGIIMPVLIVIAVGYGYARLRGDRAKEDMAAVNRFSMEVLCPLLIFSALAGRDFDVARNGPLILAGVLISLGSGLLAWPVARLLGYDIRTFLPPMIFNNCGNMGLPLAVLAFGQAGLPSAVALFMACTTVYFTVGIMIIESGRGGGAHLPSLKFLVSPMMIATAIGLAFSFARLSVPEPLFLALKMLGEACIPVMLFALGVRMIDVSFKSWHIGLVGAAVCPLAGLAVARLMDGVLTLTVAQRGQMYLFASLPPAVFCFMVAEKYRQEPDKVAAIVLIGNVAALVFVPLGLWLGLPG